MKRRGPGTLADLTALVVIGTASIVANTPFGALPRFDGAGYALLARGISSGLGYRDANDPEHPPHTHFPPGYPLALASWSRLVGPSWAAAHGFSVACTVAAIVLSWAWFRTFSTPATARLLGVALALNWTWARHGGSIQSEPLYLMLGSSSVLVASRLGREGSSGSIALGGLLAASVLTRHVGICLVVAIVIDLWWKRRLDRALATSFLFAVLLIPWIGWLARARTASQAGLLRHQGFARLVAGQMLFYLRRIPDQVTGPFVEIATVFTRSPILAALATAWGALVTASILVGWYRDLRNPRRRLAGLIPLTTFPLLLAWPFTEAGRFLIPLVPSLLVGLTDGLTAWLASRKPRRPRVKAAALVLAATLPYSAYAIATGRAGASERTYRDSDAACAWIAGQANGNGAVLGHHPGDIVLRTGRTALDVDSAGPEAIARIVERYRVGYLLVDEQPYANAPPDPLAAFVARYPGRVRLAWGPSGRVSVYTIEAQGR